MRTTRYFLLSALLILFCQAVYAQRTRNFEFDKVYPVLGKSYYNRLRVVDARISKEKLGYLKTGAFNRSADLVTEQPFAKVLSDYYAKMLLASETPGKDELVMVLHDIIIEDRAAGQEIATMFLDADLFGSRDGKYYYLGTADTLYEMSSGTDVSEKLLKGSANKIANILSMYSVMQGKEGERSFAAAELEGKRAADREQYEAYKVAGNMKPGVYYTAEQFLNNTPVDTPVVIREGSTSAGNYTTVYYPRSKTNKKPKAVRPKDVFAVCDGTQLICSHSKGFTKLKYQNGEFLSVQYFSGIGGNNGSVMMAGAMFGLVGAAIAAAADAATHKDNSANVAYHAKFLPMEKKFIPLKRYR